MDKHLDKYLVSVDPETTKVVTDKLVEMGIKVEAVYELINVLVISMDSHMFDIVISIPEVLFLEKEGSVYL